MQPYDDEIDDLGNRKAIWWARQSDRNDIQGTIFAVRHIIAHAEPGETFDGEKFVQQIPLAHFAPIIRTPEDQRKPGNVQNALEQLLMFAGSNFDPTLPYAMYDSPTVQRLITAAALEQYKFVTDILSEPPILSQEQKDEAFEGFFRLCELVEPSETTPEAINKLRSKFHLLLDIDQSKWSYGLKGLVETLYPRLWQRIEGVLEGKPQQIKDQDQVAQAKVQTILDKHLHPLARESWQNFKTV